MSKRRRELPTTIIINQFNALKPEEQAIVFDYMRSRVTTNGTSTEGKSSSRARGAGSQSRPSTQKKGLPASTVIEKDTAGDAPEVSAAGA